jgi:hypothetical protein
MIHLQHTWRRAAQIAALSFAAVAFTGCAMDRGDAVPNSAILRSEGNGPLVTYTPDGTGTGYVYDVTDNKLIWSGAVHSGQMIAVDSKRDAVLVDGRPVHEKGIHEGHRYRIFFEGVIRE